MAGNERRAVGRQHPQLLDLLLYGYLECTGSEYEADMRALGEVAITKQWLALTDPCQAPLKTAAPGEWWSMIPEIYHLD